ncbi:uncharacterized protein BT62DRAFT_696156 [Guyanagaster necrorhizus]|uniref:Uncharacterized protein n=1 Tax=Guyanagaster necrorhizus TaxID=856835 RepID=A0A9P7VGN0_9AGAR|nr:uncharacterized protein BT62DRAFT_696156 [Guyanagaster necrorhizus MCA 3950]KAG7439634.1 hypothetical protein BT62DRAFT_696156 [Guyanagaster necrorhizus MCA 3950]
MNAQLSLGDDDCGYFRRIHAGHATVYMTYESLRQRRGWNCGHRRNASTYSTSNRR